MLAAKTSIGVAEWRRDACVGQLRLPGCKADAGLPDMTVAEAARAGAKTMIIGVTNRGGVFAKAWVDLMTQALELGMDLASGLHDKLSEMPAVAQKAKALGRT